MIHKKLMSIVRGKATPAQVALACTLGSLIGFQPGPAAAPLVLATLIGLLVVLNANLFLAALIGASAFLARLLFADLQFEIGMRVIDGPLQPMFAWAANAPVLAWSGLDNYLAVGGLVLGGVIGIGSGLLAAFALIRIRTILAKLEQDSTLYTKLAENKPFRFIAWLLVGGIHAKKGTYGDLKGKLIGRPVRISGLILVAFSTVLAVILVMLLESPMTVRVLTTGLERANGATVEIESAEVDLAAGRLSLVGFAMADAEDLTRNTIEAERVDIDLANSSLLSRRFVLDQVTVQNARFDEPRLAPARRVHRSSSEDKSTGEGPGESEQPGITPNENDASDAESKSLSSYITQAETWKQRLRTTRTWLERIGSGTKSDDESSDAEPKRSRDELLSDPDLLRAYLLQRAQELGYANVTAEHLVTDSPRVLVRSLLVEGLSTRHEPGEVFDLSGTSLSSHPALVPTPAVLQIESRSGRYSASYSGSGELSITAAGLPVESIKASLSQRELLDALSGGTINLGFEGTLDAGTVDGAITATIQNATIQLPRVGPQLLDEIPVMIRVTGPIDEPRLRVDSAALREATANAVKDAAIDEGLERVEQEIDKRVGDSLDGIVDEETKKKAKDAIRGLFGGDG